MSLFEKHYSTCRFIMNIVGLWPFAGGIFTIIQRTVFPILVLSNVALQVVLLLKSAYPMQQGIIVCCTISILLLFLLRYLSFVFNISSIRCLLKFVLTEESLLQDPYEVQILAKSYENSSRVIYIAFCASFFFFVPVVWLLLTPITLDFIIPLNESRTRYFKYFLTDMFSERTPYIDALFTQRLFITAIGLLSLVCTESTFAVFAHYLCGLFRITSYRLRNAVRDATNSTLLLNQVMLNHTNIHSAVDAHRRAIECINIATTNSGISYLVATFLVVVSFSLNLYRLYKAIKVMNDAIELLLSSTVVFLHIVFIFLNNYNGQIVIDESFKVFNDLCNSSWYLAPLEVQKIILFIMLKCATPCSFNLFGLFVPCYTGFSTMMSASFSYFTLMYSTQ